MKPTNSFIDESIMCSAGEPIEYQKFTRHCSGLVVTWATQEEWDEAVQKRNSVGAED